MIWMHSARPWLLAGLLGVVTWFLYQAGVHGPWILDDYPNLQPLLDRRHLGWGALLDQFLVSHSGPLGRPVAMLTFIFSAMTSGEALAGWKQVNILLHILTGLSLYWVGRQLLMHIAGWTEHSAAYGGLLIAAMWLLHPLHVSTVLYTVQRMTILSALFSSLGLGLYLSGRQALLRGSGGWWRVMAAIAVCGPLATLSKENGALFGLYILILESLLPRIEDRQALTRLRWILGSLILLPAAAAALYFLVETNRLIGGYQLRDFTLSERLYTEARIVWEYIGWILLPIQRNLGFMHDDVVLSTGLMTPPVTLFAVLAWAVLLPGLWLLRRRSPLLVVGLGLFVASQLLESTVIPLELAYEHRNYFGSFGILLALVGMLATAVRQPLLRGTLTSAGLLLLGGLCVLRVQSWADINSLYLAMWRAHPESPRLVATFAGQFARNGQFEEAMATLRQADEPRTRVVRLYIYCLRDGALDRGILEQTAAEPPGRLTDYYLSALVAVAILGLDGDCEYDSTEYANLLDRVMTVGNASSLERYKLLIYKAHHLHKADALQAALNTLETAASLQPHSLVPLSLQTEWLAKDGQMPAARESLARLRAMAADSQTDFTARLEELAALVERNTTRDP